MSSRPRTTGRQAPGGAGDVFRTNDNTMCERYMTHIYVHHYTSLAFVKSRQPVQYIDNFIILFIGFAAQGRRLRDKDCAWVIRADEFHDINMIIDDHYIS